MSSIEKIDKNFEVKTEIEETIEETLIFRNCLESPFRVYGLISTDEGFLRLPAATAKAVSENVVFLSRNTAGGRVRFRTNSPVVAIRAKMANIGKMSHFPLTGSAGFDLYEGNTFRGIFAPPFDIQDGYESSIALPSIKEREITIHFPLYSDVLSLEIGLCAGASLLPAKGYRQEPPIVYYGSSITQGGCASRPGNSYESIISRTLDYDYLNLGFSGSALGEEAITDYIAGLEMSAFVLDYDHNAPNVEHLKNTHEKMFQSIRSRHPLLPVVMVTRPQPSPSPEEYLRRITVMETYQNALRAGDENVYFIDGSIMLHQFGGDNGMVDAHHPNDLGFTCMASAIGTVLKKFLKQ